MSCVVASLVLSHRLQVQVFVGGEVAVVDREGSIDFLKADAANKFRVQWGAAPPGEPAPYPTFADNCTAGCRKTPAHGGTCLCDLTVEEVAVVAADAGGTLPTEAELRAALMIGAADPSSAGSGYTVCTTSQCTSNPNIRVHVRGGGTGNLTAVVFDTDTVFEFTKRAAEPRPSARRWVTTS
jgi:hypothetical protein